MILLYMYFFLSSLLTTIDLEFDNGYEVASFSFGFIAFCFLIFFMFGIFTIIQRYHKRIEEDEGFRKKLSSIIEDIDVEKRRTCARFYIPIYLLRRAVFMTIIVTFDNYYLLVAHCVVMTVICAVMRPYKLASMNFMAIFNEVMITVIMAYSGVFLQKDMNNDLAVDLGWIWIALASFTIVFNWIVWIGIQIWSKLIG